MGHEQEQKLVERIGIASVAGALAFVIAGIAFFPDFMSPVYHARKNKEKSNTTVHEPAKRKLDGTYFRDNAVQSLIDSLVSYPGVRTRASVYEGMTIYGVNARKKLVLPGRIEDLEIPFRPIFEPVTGTGDLELLSASYWDHASGLKDNISYTVNHKDKTLTFWDEYQGTQDGKKYWIQRVTIGNKGEDDVFKSKGGLTEEMGGEALVKLQDRVRTLMTQSLDGQYDVGPLSIEKELVF